VDALNLVFGIVGFISFGYAIWQNRSAQSARRLTVAVTRNVQQLAREMIAASIGTPNEGYARSIEQISSSLLSGEPERQNRSVGEFQTEFLPQQLSTRVGVEHRTSDSLYGTTIRGRMTGGEWSDADFSPGRGHEIRRDSVLVYGPYRTLPVPGRYTAEFRIRRLGDAPLPQSKPLVYTDVYCLQRDEYLATQKWTIREVGTTWQAFNVTFDYVHISTRVEYRVAACVPDVDLEVDTVRVKLQDAF
jgi:hypothetical protein